MLCCPEVFHADTAIPERLRFARACQIRGFPVLLPGMLVRRSVVAPGSVGSDPQGRLYSIRSLCARSWIHGMQGARELVGAGLKPAPTFPLRRSVPMFLSGVALTRTPCAGMRSCRRGEPLIKVSAARPQGKRCRDGKPWNDRPYRNRARPRGQAMSHPK